MDHKSSVITLYTSQSETVRQTLLRDGVCFSKADYVRRKYGESAPVFLTAYRWFAENAAALVPRPAEAELPYWAFGELYRVDATGNPGTLALRVPAEEAVFFDLYDWNKVLRLRYLGETAEEEAAFHRELAARGLTEQAVMLTAFYPEWKARILESWARLFRHHEQIRRGDLSGVGGVQAGLWQLRREWLAE